MRGTGDNRLRALTGQQVTVPRGAPLSRKRTGPGVVPKACSLYQPGVPWGVRGLSQVPLLPPPLPSRKRTGPMEEARNLYRPRTLLPGTRQCPHPPSGEDPPSYAPYSLGSGLTVSFVPYSLGSGPLPREDGTQPETQDSKPETRHRRSHSGHRGELYTAVRL